MAGTPEDQDCEASEQDCYCSRCEGRGQVDTGIDESPTTICNKCNGTGMSEIFIAVVKD